VADRGSPRDPRLRAGIRQAAPAAAQAAPRLGLPQARRAGIDAPALEATLAEFNRHAREGKDPAFAKGSTAYNRFYGDPDIQPNICVAPLAQAPFYAVKVVIGDLGTYDGIATNGHAQVLDGNKRPIPGLYAAGNDALSIMGGNYPGPGITLGPAMTFGWLAARHLAGKPENRGQSPISGAPNFR
jgi:succinate dehydrogenase/fumarate reductase flavoprotein subunit